MTTTTDPATASTPVGGERRVDILLAHYGESHQNPRNELIHFIAIPLIMLSLVGMMFALHPYVAYAFIAASMVYYARLSVVFLITMALLSAAFIGVIFAMGPLVLPVCIAIFVGAWILQFIGHKIEGKKPSFFTDLIYLMIGPIWVLSKFYRKMGWKY